MEVGVKRKVKINCPGCGNRLDAHCHAMGCDSYKCVACKMWGTLALVKGAYRFTRYVRLAKR